MTQPFMHVNSICNNSKITSSSFMKIGINIIPFEAMYLYIFARPQYKHGSSASFDLEATPALLKSSDTQNGPKDS
jgi:hypothetical protein